MFPLSIWIKIAKEDRSVWYNLCLCVKKLAQCALNKESQNKIKTHFIQKLKTSTPRIQTLLVSTCKDTKWWFRDEFLIFCPFCHRKSFSFEYDDYVASNCLFWCGNCGEILICPKGMNCKNECDIRRIALHEEPAFSCTKKISETEAIKFVENWTFDIKKTPNTKYPSDLEYPFLHDLIRKSTDLSNDHYPKYISSKVSYYLVSVIALTGLKKKSKKNLLFSVLILLYCVSKTCQKTLILLTMAIVFITKDFAVVAIRINVLIFGETEI